MCGQTDGHDEGNRCSWRLKTTEVIKLHYVPEPGLINYVTFLHENITDRPVGHNNSPELHTSYNRLGLA